MKTEHMNNPSYYDLVDGNTKGEYTWEVFYSNMITSGSKYARIFAHYCIVIFVAIVKHIISIAGFLFTIGNDFMAVILINLPDYIDFSKRVLTRAIKIAGVYLGYLIDFIRNLDFKYTAAITTFTLVMPLAKLYFQSPPAISPLVPQYPGIMDMHTTSRLTPLVLGSGFSGASNTMPHMKCIEEQLKPSAYTPSSSLLPTTHTQGQHVEEAFGGYKTKKADIGIYPCQNGIWWTIKTIFYRTYTWIIGILSNIYIPTCFMRELIFGLYSWIYQIDMEEYGNCPCQYDTLNLFFTRKLLPGTRTICMDSPLVSPCDGLVSSAGLITIDGTNICELDNFILAEVKGIRYKLSKFLGEDCRSILLSEKDEPMSFLDAPIPKYLAYFILRLSPGDCHRFYMPTNAAIHEIRHISGEKLPLFDACPNILAVNERVVTLGTWTIGHQDSTHQLLQQSAEHCTTGAMSQNKTQSPDKKPLRFSMTMVGAAGAGSIFLDLDGREERITEPEAFQMVTKTTLEKGEEFGHFELGSAIVLLVELSADNPSDRSLVFSIKEGDRVQIGQPLLSFAGTDGATQLA